MTDDKIGFKIFGRKINKENKGYTDVEYDGIAKPVLKIPEDIPKGRRRITAVYTDEKREVYAPSLDRTWLIYGSKCYVHCPNLYVRDTQKNVTLVANIFSNNRPVPGGNAKFKISSKTVSTKKLYVINGYLEETHKTTIKKTTLYQCVYEGSELYKISEGEGEGAIFPYHEDKTDIIVDVMRIITNQLDNCDNGKTKLVARVYHAQKQYDYVDHTTDVPTSGIVTFFIDGQKVSYNNQSSFKIGRNGFVTVPITPSDYEVGVHDIVAIYSPDTPETKVLYSQRAGSNTLFVGNDENKPCLFQSELNCGATNESHEFVFNTSDVLNGRIRLFIDGICVNANECVENGTLEFMGNEQVCYEQVVENKTYFTFNVRVPKYTAGNLSTSWGYSGYHNMMIQYLEKNDEIGDMEYWYFWNDFYIQINPNIYIENTTIDNTADGSSFTGNNIFIKSSPTNIRLYRPNLTTVPKSKIVGDKIRIHVEDEDTKNPIKTGKVKVTITTRKKEKWAE